MAAGTSHTTISIKLNEQGFHDIFNKYYVTLCLFANQYTENQETSADIVQDSFAKLWQIREDFFYLHQVKAFLYTEQKIRDFETITNRLEHEEKMKVYDLCYWLKGRDIDYKLSFKYNKSKPIKWNIAKYHNFIRLKIRINKEYS